MTSHGSPKVTQNFYVFVRRDDLGKLCGHTTSLKNKWDMCCVSDDLKQGMKRAISKNNQQRQKQQISL